MAYSVLSLYKSLQTEQSNLFWKEKNRTIFIAHRAIYKSALSFFLSFRFVTFLQGKPSKHKHGALVKEALAKGALAKGHSLRGHSLRGHSPRGHSLRGHSLRGHTFGLSLEW